MIDDFFRDRLDAMIDLRHPLAVLATRMTLMEMDVELAQVKMECYNESQLRQEGA